MSESNKSMTDSAYQHAHLADGECILEVGHGNGAHIPKLTKNLKNYSFHGAEISEVMHLEANNNNKELIAHFICMTVLNSHFILIVLIKSFL